jgi:hypothetical protein
VRPTKAKSMCWAHYAKNLRAEKGEKSYQSYLPGPTCKATGCERPIKAKGLCNPHYNRNRRGEPVDGVPINKRSSSIVPQLAASNAARTALGSRPRSRT